MGTNLSSCLFSDGSYKRESIELDLLSCAGEEDQLCIHYLETEVKLKISYRHTSRQEEKVPPC